MAFVYPNVDVGAETYNTYADQDAADVYLGADITATAWLTATNDTKGQALTSATRWLDSVHWKGVVADPAQELQFPRTGIDGADSSTIPLQIANACIALAGALADNPTLRADLGQPIARELAAGSVHITYFRPNDVFISTPFPPNVMAMVGSLLAGTGTSAGTPTITGTDAESPLEDDFGLVHGF